MIDWSGTPAAGSEPLLGLVDGLYVFRVTDRTRATARTWVGYRVGDREMLVRCNGESHTDVGDSTRALTWVYWVGTWSADTLVSNQAATDAAYAAVCWAELGDHEVHCMEEVPNTTPPAALRLFAAGHPLDWARSYVSSQT